MRKSIVLLIVATLWLLPLRAQKIELGPMPTPTADTARYSHGQVSLTGTGAFLLADILSGRTYKELSQRYTFVMQDNGPCVPAFIELADGISRSRLSDYGVHVQGNGRHILSVLIPLSSYTELIYSGVCSRIDVGDRATPTLDRVRTYMGIDSIHNNLNLPSGYKGAGVVVGVVDVGFEYGHPAFYDSTGTTLRIKRVWEQEATSGTRPSGFTYGRELTTQSAILAAAKSETDETHGTHVAGIAAGCGGNTAAMRQFRGIAPEADIVLVACNRTASGLYDGIEYIGNYAASVGKPCVVNLSWGSHVGPHDGTSSFDRSCDDYLAQRNGGGMLLVGSAGNEGDNNLHIAKTFTASDTLLYTLVDFDGSSAGETYIDLWGIGNDVFQVGLAILDASTGRFEESGYFRRSSANYTYTERLTDNDGERMSATLYCNGVDSYNNRSNVTIYIDNTAQTSNNQRVILVLKARSGTVHLWGSKCTFINGGFSALTAGNNWYTVGERGGTGNSMITVGAYTTRSGWVSRTGSPYDISYRATEGNIAYFSSHGPLLDGRTKPDIVAPGQMTIAPINRFNTSYVNGGYTTNAMSFNGNTEYFACMQGTSMSAPSVAGVMALWLQRDPTLTPSRALQLLHNSAITDNFTGNLPANGDITWGYGKINALAGFDAASSSDPLDTTTCTITSLPYSTDFENGARCWSLRDADQDSNSWGLIRNYGYGGSIAAYVSSGTNSDDWFYTPALVGAGDVEVNWKVRTFNNDSVETYQVWLLTQDTSIRLFAESLATINYEDRSATFRLQPTDTARVMFRYISANKAGMLIDDVALQATTLYTLTVASSNVAQGTVSGGGLYVDGSTVMIAATANTGFRFTCWQDGDATNPRNVLVGSDSTFTAYFAADVDTATSPIDTSTCVITALPYFIDFDSNIYCWRLRDADRNDTTWGLIGRYGVDSSRCMFINPASNANDWLISPPITVAGRASVSWKACNYGAARTNTYQVWTMTSDTAILIFSETLTSTVFADRSATFEIVPGDTAQIVFQYISSFGTAFFLDNIAIQQVTSPAQYTLTVASADPQQGSVSGGGTYSGGSVATLTATPATGYHFTRWQDGNTDNPRQIRVTANASYTAYFESDQVPVQYTLTVISASMMQGVVSGGGTYNDGATATLTATPNSGYHFLRWQDGNTDNPRTVTVTANATYTAYFEADAAPTPTQFTLTVTSSNPAQGSVSGGGTYSAGDTAIIVATPASGYHFLRWQDGNTDNPRSIVVTADASHTAYFESDQTPSQFTITATSADPSQGSVSGGGTYTIGDTAVLIATPHTGYIFFCWNDGNTDNPRSIVVRSNGTYTAYFGADPNPPAPTQYTLTVVSADPQQGSVTGGGTYNENASAVLTATPNSGYHFLRWNDNNTDNPRTVTVTADATYTAYFETDANPPAPTQYTLTVVSADPQQGSVTGGGTYNENASAVLTATPNSGYHFLRWNDNNTDNPRTVTVTADATYTAYFEADANPPAPTQYTLTVVSADPQQGSVTGGGTYNENASAVLTATPNSGYHFLRWNDNNTGNPRTVTVTADATYTAYFEADSTEGINHVVANGVTIRVNDGRISVETQGGSLPTYSVCDVTGRCLYRRTEGQSATDGPQLPTGVYFVRIDGQAAQKVVVMR